MIPTPHSVEVVNSEKVDIWGEAVPSENKTHKSFIRSVSQVVDNSYGQETFSKYTLLFIGLIPFTETDTFTFEEANEKVVESQPINIKFMRNIDGDVAFTKVFM